MKKLTVILTTAVALSLLLYVPLLSQTAPEPYAFSRLFADADLVVFGNVASAANNNSNYSFKFVVKEVLYGSDPGSAVSVVSPMSNGFFLPDELYPENSAEYILFLKAQGNSYRVASGYAGTMKPAEKEELSTLITAYVSNRGLFTAGQKTAYKALFNTISSSAIKNRMLYDLENTLTANDIPFIRSLLRGENTIHKTFALNAAGKLRIEALRTEIETILSSSGNHSVKMHSIISLGNIRNKNSISFIMEYLSSADDPLRRVAVEAAGKIGDSAFLSRLQSMYPNETDIGMKLSIITAVSRMQGKTAVKAALESFHAAETETLAQRIIARKINALKNNP